MYILAYQSIYKLTTCYILDIRYYPYFTYGRTEVTCPRLSITGNKG